MPDSSRAGDNLKHQLSMSVPAQKIYSQYQTTLQFNKDLELINYALHQIKKEVQA